MSESENTELKKCVECARVFNLSNENDANEFYYGHDCESD